VAEIDLGALRFNYRQIRRRIPKKAKILGVVKADAYGHGALPVSLELEKLGVEYLGVAISEEGVQLRQGGVKAPILVLGGIFPGEADRIFKFDLTPVVFQKESLEILSREAGKKKRKARIHLKVDTGMGRLGAPPGLWRDLLKETKRFPQIEVEGILSHFSMADEDGGQYSASQWGQFEEALGAATEMGVSCRYAHMANSANLTFFPGFSGNLVRPGIMLYGAYPAPSCCGLVPLKPVMRLKTAIHFIKSVPSGRKLSYGGTFVTPKESLIATLPIGYADGYRWNLSNRGEILVRGKRAPVVGRVCMDYVLADVSEIKGVHVGDEAVLMGSQGGEQITAEEIAGKVGTISYEIFCSVGKRVPRVYVE
jgi:alanine racemase